MQSSQHHKEKSGSNQIRRGRIATTRSIIDDLETDKESVISDYEERGSQRSNTFNNPHDELSRSFSSINRSFLQQKGYSTNESQQSQSSTASFHSDDPYIMTASGRLNSNNVLKRNSGMLTSSTRMNRRAHMTGNKQAIESSTSSQVDESSFCTSQLDDFKQKGNGLFFDEDIDDFEDEAEEQDLTAEERALMEKWMFVFQRMLKNVKHILMGEAKNEADISEKRIKEEDAFEYLLEEELSLAQFGWNHSATILATISKIYSLKVDRLCHESYHLLASLARGSTKSSQSIEESNTQVTNLASNQKSRKHEEEREGNIVNGSFGQFLAMYEGGHGDQKQVMKNDRIGQLNRIEMEFEVDPLFRKTSICFDSSSSAGLLLNILPLRSEIVMTLGEIEIENAHRDNPKKSQTHEEGQEDSNKNNDSSIWKKMRRAAAEIASIESWDVLPELIDFKITVNQQQEQLLLNSNAFNASNALQQVTPSSSLFLKTQRNSNSIEKGYSDLLDEGQSESDKKLMDEIEFMLTQDTITTNNRIEQVSTALKGRTSVGATNRSKPTPDMQTPINMRQGGGRQFEDTLHAQNLSQIDHFDHDISFGSLGSADSQSSSSQGFDSQSLNSSIHRLGRGDKSVLSPVCMNLNWGDPKQWEIQKPVIGRLTKKTKLKQNADAALGAIREDLMEAEDPNDRQNLNAQYNQLTRQPPRLIEFDIDLDDAEDYNVVMACKKTKKNKPNKKKGSLRIRKIVDRNQIQKDHRITTDKVFRIGLRNMKETGMPRFKVHEGEFMGDMFDFLDRSFSHRGVSDQKDEGFGFDDGFGGDRESARKANRRVSLLGSTITPFDDNSANDLSPAGYGREFEYRTAMKPAGRQFFSQTQTAAKHNLKIKELKETVWTCMTASKNSQEYAYSLQPLSQFTAKKESPVATRQSRRNNQRNSTGSVQSAVSATSFASIVLEQNGLGGSIKFTDVMTQVSSGLGEATLAQSGVSIQNCFISLLHLANEKSLRLIDPSHTEAEFFIFEDDQEGQNHKMEESS